LQRLPKERLRFFVQGRLRFLLSYVLDDGDCQGDCGGNYFFHGIIFFVVRPTIGLRLQRYGAYQSPPNVFLVLMVVTHLPPLRASI